jgi:hypothetical protein
MAANVAATRELKKKLKTYTDTRTSAYYIEQSRFTREGGQA